MTNGIALLVTVLSLSLGAVGIGTATQSPTEFVPEKTAQVITVKEVTVIGQLPQPKVLIGAVKVTNVTHKAATPKTQKITEIRRFLSAHKVSVPNPQYLPGAL